MAFGSASAWHLIEGWFCCCEWQTWGMSSQNQKSPPFLAVSHPQNKRNCGSTHRFAFKDLVAMAGRVLRQCSSTETENRCSGKTQVQDTPSLIYGSHVSTSLLRVAPEPFNPPTEQRVEVTSALGHHSSLLDLGQWAQCSLLLLIPEVLEQFPPLPKGRVLKVVLWLSREQCQNEGSAEVALTDSWTRTWLDHQSVFLQKATWNFIRQNSSLSPIICVWQRLAARNWSQIHPGLKMTRRCGFSDS